MTVLDYTTEAMLREWGKWVNMGKPGAKGVQSWMGQMVDRMVQRSGGASLAVQESKMEDFDTKVMLVIKLNSPNAYEALEFYYKNKSATVDDLAKKIKRRKQTATDLLRLGRELVECLIFESGVKIA